MDYFLKFSLLLLITFGLTAGSLFCPDKLVNEWMEAAGTLQTSIRHILNNPTIANSSLSNRELYKLLANDLGMPVTSDGFDNFQEATSEIIAAKLVACSDPKRESVSMDDISKFVASFTAFIDAKNMTQVYKSYGKLLCLQELLLGNDATKSRWELHTESGPLKDFFDSLDGTRLTTIFGFDPYHPDSRPTLAFAVDDTGSMH